MTPSSPLIDVHTHVVPHGLPFGHDERFAAFVDKGDTADVLVGGALFRTVPREAWDVEARVAAMDADGIAMQAISVMPELFSYWAEPDLGRRFCAEPQRGGRGDGRGRTRPPRRAGRRAPAGPRPGDRDASTTSASWGSPASRSAPTCSARSPARCEFLPFFQAVADAGLCVFVHAFHPPYWDCIADPPMAAAVNFPSEIGTSVAADGGERVRRAEPRPARSCSSHGGGTLPLHLPRMAAVLGRRPCPRPSAGRRTTRCAPCGSTRSPTHRPSCAH